MSLESESATTTHRRSTSFLGDVIRLVTGTGLSQVIALIAAPILTRLYYPEDYGFAALFISITAIIGVVACLRYELSIVLPTEDREAANLVAASILAAIFLAVLSIPIIWIVQSSWLEAPARFDLGVFLWLIPFVIVIQGTYQALKYWNSRARRYTRLSVAAVTGSLTTTSSQLGAAFAGHATGGAMIMAKVGGQVLATAALTTMILREHGRFFVQHVHCGEIANGFRRYRKFPIFSSAASLLNTLSWQLPVFMFSIFFGPEAVGFYALGFQLLQVPMTLIGGSISQVFFQRAAEAKDDGTLAPLVEGLFEGLTVICILPILILAIVGRDLFSVAFGSHWAEAGVYAQILSIWAYVWFVSSPLSTVFAVFERQEKALQMQVVIFASRLLSLGFGAYLGEPRIALAVFSLAGVFAYGYLSIYIFRLAGVRLAKPARILIDQLLLSVPFLLPVVLLSVFHVKPLYVVAMAVVSGLAYVFAQRKRVSVIVKLRASTND